MTQFWMVAAGLVALAILFFIPTLLRKRPSEDVSSNELNITLIKQQLAELDADLESGELDQEHYEASRRDLEKELLEDISGSDSALTGSPKAGRFAIAVLLLAVPAMAIPLYLTIGSPGIIPRLAEAPIQGSEAAQAGHEAPGQSMASMVDLVEKLAQRLEQEPNNPDGWKMLGRSYMALNRFGDALKAYEKAYALNPNDSDLLLAYASTMAQINNNDFTGRPAELIAKALELDPQNPNVLWLMGINHFQSGEYPQAVQYWEQVLAQLEPGSEEAMSVAEYLREARSKLPAGSQATVTTTEKTEPVQAAGGKIQVTVSLDPALRDKVQGSDRVFIFARALQGPPMPLAAIRRQVKDLPATLVLDDSMAMMPELVLSNFDQVAVGARISKSGDPKPQSGDLQGEISPVKPGQEGTIQLVVNSVLP